MHRIIASVAAALLLAGCEQQAARSTPTSNPNFKVDFLFEHDGCRVFRFFDARTVYFVNCAAPGAGRRGQAIWEERVYCGKGCTRVVLRNVGAL